jgi:GTPase SAR1 family protein
MAVRTNVYKEVIKKGKKSWNRTKIMLMGEGRAGKTCLGRALLGKPFENTSSTEALDTLAVGINCGAFTDNGKNWEERPQSNCVLEEAIGAMARDAPVSPPPNGVFTGLSRLIFGSGSLRPGTTQLSVADGISVDTTTLIRKVASGELGKSGTEVSLYDFGGQEVFNCLHPFFLTRFGVSIVVFDMTWFADEGSEKAVEALSYLSFWLNSVVLNTSREDGTSRVVLVGTHKDVVADATDHVRISTLLSEAFCGSPAWSSIVQSDGNPLIFFPVDSTLGDNDEVIRELRKVVEAILENDSHVKIERPLTWYHALDTLNALQRGGQHSITFERATQVLTSSGIPQDEVEQVLSLFRDMGSLMWYEERPLKDVVILDAVSFFVKPVARVICVPELHCVDAHGYCSRHYRQDYPEMTKHGIVSRSLLCGLLGYGKNNDNCEMLTALMLKYGLLVSWKLRDSVEPTYLVPALFPLDDSVSKRIDVVDRQAWAHGKPVTTVYVVFSLRKTLLGSGVRVKDLAKHCFLPSGLFDRLLCTLLEWSQHCGDIDPLTFQLKKNVAVMQIANVSFRLVWRSASNCIELNTTSLTPITLIRRLEKILTRLLKESIQSLYLQSAILVEETSELAVADAPNDCLVPVTGCRAAVPAGKFPSLVDNTEIVVDHAAIIRQHPWLTGASLVDPVDVFLSHRWGDCDDPFVSALNDRISDYVVAGSPLSVFYDVSHMKTGDRLNLEFFKGLLRTVTMVPIVSVNALQRILKHKPVNVDNILVEWLTALVLISYPTHFQVPLRTIVPLCFSDSSGYGYFSVSGQLPLLVPTATCEAVLDLFRLVGIILPADVVTFIRTITVKKVVDGIMTSICVTVDLNKPLADVISVCTAEIMNVVLRGV